MPHFCETAFQPWFRLNGAMDNGILSCRSGGFVANTCDQIIIGDVEQMPSGGRLEYGEGLSSTQECLRVVSI